jgi:hypothetical protein
MTPTSRKRAGGKPYHDSKSAGARPRACSSSIHRALQGLGRGALSQAVEGKKVVAQSKPGRGLEPLTPSLPWTCSTN